MKAYACETFRKTVGTGLGLAAGVVVLAVADRVAARLLWGYLR